LNLQRRALEASAARERVRRSEASLRDSTRRTAAAPLSGPTFPSSGGIHRGMPSPISRPPFQPLGGSAFASSGPRMGPGYMAPPRTFHIPTWRDYHTPKNVGNPFGVGTQ